MRETRLVQTWVTVADGDGTHLEARWVEQPVAAEVAHAA
jgi:hypothetical protein